MDTIAINALLAAIQQLHDHDFFLKGLKDLPKELIPVGNALKELANSLESQLYEQLKLDEITLQINSGLLLEEVLEKAYEIFHKLLPYNRIGFSLISEDGKDITARWAKTDQDIVKLEVGYKSTLHGSSLEKIIATSHPRILNNLIEYLQNKPDSESTQLVIAEGMRSSLTCPLIVDGKAVGFIFFSSIKADTYTNEHIKVFQRIASHLSIILEKSKLASELSEQKKVIEDQNERLNALNELKNSFLGIAAHDLRNPLANIKMILDMMTSDISDHQGSDISQWLTELDSQTDYMLGLLDELLDVTRIESGKLILIPVLFDINSFLEESVYRNNQLATRKNTNIVLETLAGGQIFGDTRRLRQVMDNLLSNAIKFSPANSLIKVRAKHLDRSWKIMVEDQGPGITEKDRARLFKDFAKLSARPTGGEKSTGLGLAISRRVVEAHGGSIGVDSTPGKGSIFWFILSDS